MKKKRLSLFIACCLISLSLPLKSQERVRWNFMPQWTPQAQFAGYYVAYQKGFYDELGIDLTIKHISPYATTTPLDKLLDGEVDIIVQKLQQTIMKRSEGIKLLSILQVSQNSGLMCVSTHPISSPESLNGLKIGQWKTGHHELCQMLEKEYGLNIKWVPFLQSMNLLITGAIDASLCYSYNEYFLLLFSLGEIPSENVFRFSEFGYNFPEDALCVTESFYNKNKEALGRFIEASKRGWDYTNEHQEEALDIVMKYVVQENVATNRYHQKCMLNEVLNLQKNWETGERNYAPISKDLFGDLVSRMLEDSLIMKNVKYEEVIR